MHKSELARRLMNEMSAQYPELTDTLIKESVDALLHIIIDTLSEGGNMEIRGFGSFHLRYYGERQTRNPKTSQVTIMSPRCRLFFKASKKLKLRLNASYR